MVCIDDCITEANKYFHLKYFLVVKLVNIHQISVVKIGSHENMADILTKSFGHPAFGNHRMSIGINKF